MSADAFTESRRRDWQRLERLLAGRSKGQAKVDATQGNQDAAGDLLELALLYRAACADAARARTAGADDATVAYLDGLLARAHNLLYRSPPGRRGAVAAFLQRDFPRALRRHARFFAAANLVFWLPFVFGVAAAALLPGFAAGVLGETQMEMFRQMYASAPEDARGLGEGSLAVSFYVQHNTSIAFEVFACGIFAGVGSLAMLTYQGLMLGSVFGFLLADAKGRHLLTFTCGHTAWELTAIVVAGAAGLRMGWALVETGGLTRSASLRGARGDLFALVGGAAVMLAVAAVIEGLWSPSLAPAPLKWLFAGVQVAVVTAWLGWSGRPRPAPGPVESGTRPGETTRGAP